jgi:hypothetical protein
VESGLSPIDLERCSTEMLDTISDYLTAREKAQKQQQGKSDRATGSTGRQKVR